MKAQAALTGPCVSKLLVSDFRYDRSFQTAQDIFKKPSAKFAAIDGSMDQNLLGGLAVFWAGAYAATGSITYAKDRNPTVTYDTHFVEKGHGLASCVPIYIDSIPEVEPQSTFSRSAGEAISGPLTDQSTVDNSTIANWIMLFSELYLAYTMAKTRDFQIILLDRSLSGTQSSLLHDTSKRALWKRECATLRITSDGLRLDEQDLCFQQVPHPRQ